ncbi:MAG: gliding motility-associated ABC transporter ATP-binding subunit GldA [Flavobacteriales bacterium]|jgi:ABC-2 type transport system ATP-binding protein|nr:gliding motility-associated ABC transporter ATP-binding subunit GldA [Flavobacteriales bacterium]
MTLTVTNISKTYGTQEVLNKINFSVKQGEIVGVLGPNGAGKSTLFKILTSYLKPTSGSAKIAGIDISENPLAVKKNIGYLPENNPLYLTMYVKEYLEFLADLHKISKQNIATVIAQVGLADEAHKKISELSKGYKQRVGLASALLHDPSVLLLDEPTTGLDPNQLIEIRNLIKEIGKTKTILFSSHILQEVEAICQRVLLINKGALVADINLSELKAASEQQLEVTFDKPISAAVLNTHLHLKNATSINENSWLLTFENETDTGNVLFDFSKKQGYKILQMAQKTDTLESLFKRLTS